MGDFVSHGKSLAPTGTSIVFLLSTIEEVESIDVYCPKQNEEIETITLPPKIRLIEAYRYDSAFSLLKLLRLRRSSYDKIIFNILSTAFGNSSISNAVGISIPIVFARIFGMNNVEVIYHNSVLTNNMTKLGYTSVYDQFRSRILRIIEISMFKNVETFVLLKLYKGRIDQILNKNEVKFLSAKYLEAFATVFLNEVQYKETISIDRTNKVPRILLHGNWGPQKNIELAITALSKIREDGCRFDLTITGGINHHFPEYEEHFMNILTQYNFISSYKGSITEREIYRIFTTSDLLLLPYNTPGGHSAVLEQAIFFEVPTVAIDFPEYREQGGGCRFYKTMFSSRILPKRYTCFR